MTDRGEPGKTGQTGQTGKTGSTGAQGVQGVPGVSLTVEQLESYIRRLEGRYQRVAIRLTVALVVVSVALLATLAWSAAGLRDRVDDARAERRVSILELCQEVNTTNRGIVQFLREVSTPERVELGRETFPITDCDAAVEGLPTR
jgi:hypothetical protein